MDLRLMGNVEIHDGTRPIRLPRAGERCVLASLALQPGRRIHVDALIDRLWGDDPPTGAVDTIASYVRTVRKAVEDAGGQRDWLRNHRPATYELGIDPDLVDYHRFGGLVGQARARRRDGRPADAVALYEGALALRTAEALCNVTGQWAANRRHAIELHYLDALCELYEQQLAIGDYITVAASATDLVMEVVPTDHMITLAVRGLAGSGKHAAIPDFLTRATRRMWDAARARPGRQVFAIARQLMANPNARLPSIDVQPAGASSDDGDEPVPREPARDRGITMTAEHNQQVYQSAGDQYIIGA